MACQAWWGAREHNQWAWRVPVAELLAGGCNLDQKNPTVAERFAQVPPQEIVASILEKERRIMDLLAEIASVLPR